MHSQHKEHEIIIPFFDDIDPKTLNFLDIGANDGVSFSNTWDLYILGWNGCCVEPSVEAFSLLSENYKGSNNINLFNYGISDKEGIFTFYESRNWLDRDDTPPAILSSLHQSHKNNFYGMHWVETECRFVTFKNFIDESPIKRFDFISIDVEGHDLVVLKQIDLAKVECKMLCIEYNRNLEMLEEFRNYCKDYNMNEIHRNDDNVIFALNGNQ